MLSPTVYNAAQILTFAHVGLLVRSACRRQSRYGRAARPATRKRPSSASTALGPNQKMLLDRTLRTLATQRSPHV
ncbi:hypothetical protein M3J09_000779 [Ascochyta lentis]